MSEIKNKLVTQSLDQLFKESGPKQTETVLLAVFGHFEAIWTTLNGPQKVDKGPQVGGMYGLMSKLK
jgi:hypothetical protein